MPRVFVTNPSKILRDGASLVGVGSSWANSESVDISVAEFRISLDDSEVVSQEPI